MSVHDQICLYVVCFLFGMFVLGPAYIAWKNRRG